MKRQLLYFILLSSVAVAGQAKKQELPIDPGPPPASIEEFHRLGEQALLSNFFDPSSAQIQWDRAITGGSFKPVLGRRVIGWWTCGLINGKNRMGAYVGFRRFVVVERNGAVVFFDFGTADYNMSGPVCEQMIANNTLGPASSQTLVNTVDINKPVLGFGWNIVPDGIYLNLILKGSPADATKLLQGNVISGINGIPIKGFDASAIIKIFNSSDTFTLTIVGRGDVKITKLLIKS